MTHTSSSPKNSLPRSGLQIGRWLWPLISLTSLVGLAALTWHYNKTLKKIQQSSHTMEQVIQTQTHTWTDEISPLKQQLQMLSQEQAQQLEQLQTLSEAIKNSPQHSPLQPPFDHSLKSLWLTHQALMSYHFFRSQQYPQALHWLKNLELAQKNFTPKNPQAPMAIIHDLKQHLSPLAKSTHTDPQQTLFTLQKTLENAVLWPKRLAQNSATDTPSPTVDKSTFDTPKTGNDTTALPTSSQNATSQGVVSQTTPSSQESNALHTDQSATASLRQHLSQFWITIKNFLLRDIVIESNLHKQQTLLRQEQAMLRTWMINLATQAAVALQNHQTIRAHQSLNILAETLKRQTPPSESQRQILLLIHQVREAFSHDTQAISHLYQTLFQQLSTISTDSPPQTAG